MKKPTRLGLLATAITTALLVSACGGGGSTEAYTPSYPDSDSNTTNDYEADISSNYDDEDYDLEEYAYYATPNLEVGATLTAEEAEATREALRGMDNEERAGRVVIQLADGTFEIRDWQTLQPGDEIPVEDIFQVQWTGVSLFQDPNGDGGAFVFDVNNPDPVITNFIADINFRHDFERGQSASWMNWRDEQFGNAIAPVGEDWRLDDFNANPVRFSNISESVERWWGAEGLNVVTVARDPDSASNNQWTLIVPTRIGDIWRNAGITPRSSDAERLNVLRDFARNNPNEVVIGPDGVRITGQLY